MIIQNVSYQKMWIVMLISILSAIFLYNFFALILQFTRKKKVKKAIQMIADGHRNVESSRKTLVIDGIELDDQYIYKRIGALKKETDDLRKKSPKEQKKLQKQIERAEKTKERKEKKNKSAKQIKQAPTVRDTVNDIYEYGDMFDVALDSFYRSGSVEIKDQKVRANVLSKLTKSRKKKEIKH